MPAKVPILVHLLLPGEGARHQFPTRIIAFLKVHFIGAKIKLKSSFSTGSLCLLFGEDMRGQWIGKYKGSAEGSVILNIDETTDRFEGIAYVRPSDPQIPCTAAHFVTHNKSLKQKVTAYLNPIDPRNGFQCRWDKIKHLYGENVVHSDKAEISFEVSGEVLHINATTDLGLEFSSEIKAPRKTDQSMISGNQMSWEEFKIHIAQKSKTKFLFRGQQKPWKLRTAFHRRGRYLMGRFTGQDVRQLHRRLSAITSHYFNLSVAEENGAFFNLMQHHGYPTPLLDWSHSPYVAAFFAFRDWPIRYTGKGKARIYVFNEQDWCQHFPQIQNLDPSFLHLSVMEFIAIDNPRMVPQQSVTTVTNIDDIESYIVEKETQTGNRYLEAIDIPAKERKKAMRDLKFMGITAGSMFPSIDGVCEELRESNFDK